MLDRLPVAYWVHTPHPFLVRFTETMGIRYYGLAYLAGFVGAGALLLWYHRRGRSPFDLTAISDLMTYLVAGVLVGGRLGYFILYQPRTLLSDPLNLFRVWEGGMASHGGFLGVVVAMVLFARRHRVSFLQVSDLIVTVAPLGLLLGRLANFVNGELWGKVTSVPWAMIFSQTGGGNYPRHPSQLYEAALEGLFLLSYLQLRFWRSAVARLHPGSLAGEFLIAYAGVRMVCEVYREPDAELILGLSRGTFYSIFLIVAGAIVIAIARRTNSERKA
jgi:phosphatidylglycerol:prolipoprotein diacylglycerol transferase